jgi:hypothetical protein
MSNAIETAKALVAEKARELKARGINVAVRKSYIEGMAKEEWYRLNQTLSGWEEFMPADLVNPFGAVPPRDEREDEPIVCPVIQGANAMVEDVPEEDAGNLPETPKGKPGRPRKVKE